MESTCWNTAFPLAAPLGYAFVFLVSKKEPCPAVPWKAGGGPWAQRSRIAGTDSLFSSPFSVSPSGLTQPQAGRARSAGSR